MLRKSMWAPACAFSGLCFGIYFWNSCSGEPCPCDLEAAWRLVTWIWNRSELKTIEDHLIMLDYGDCCWPFSKFPIVSSFSLHDFILMQHVIAIPSFRQPMSPRRTNTIYICFLFDVITCNYFVSFFQSFLHQILVHFAGHAAAERRVAARYTAAHGQSDHGYWTTCEGSQTHGSWFTRQTIATLHSYS